MEGSAAVRARAVRARAIAPVEVPARIHEFRQKMKMEGVSRALKNFHAEDAPEARSNAERVRRDEADVGGGARAGRGRVHERRLDERAALAVEPAAA